MKIEIMTRKQIREEIKEEIEKKLDLVYKELDNIRKKMILLEDMIKISKLKV